MMKKALMVLFVLAFVGAAAFADGGKFTAWNQGDVYLYTSIGGGAGTVGWGPTWDYTTANSNGPGPDQEWGFGWDGKNIGFSATIEFGGTPLLGSNGSSYWFGTYYKFGDLVKLTLGAPRIDYRTGDYIEGIQPYNRLVEAQYSVTAEIYPMSGLTVGLAMYVPNNEGSIANVFGANWTALTGAVGAGGWQGVASATAADYANNIGVVAQYALPNLGTFTLQYRRAGTSGTNNGQLGIGAVISAVKNIGIAASAGINLDTTTTITAMGSVNAAFAPLTVQATGAYSTGSSSFAAEAKVEYAMGTYAAGAQIGYDDGKGIALLNQACGSWDGFQVYPYAKANFDGGYIQLGVVYATGANGHSSVIAVPIQYSWSF